MSTPRLLMLNYPHNTTGTLASRDFFAQIVGLGKRYKFMVVNDFAYARVTFDGYTAPSFLEVPGAMDVGVAFGSFSKSYHFSPIQIAGIVAMRDCEDDIVAQARHYQNRRDVMCEGLTRMGWPVEKPMAGMFVWVKIPEPWSRMGSGNLPWK